MALCIGLFPIKDFSDKERYLNLYLKIYYSMHSVDYKDAGWEGFVKLCTYIFGRNYHLFFLLVSIIYCFSYYIFGKHYFGKEYVAYFVILSFGCLGFSGYGTNVIRSGFALALLLIALRYNSKKWLAGLLSIISVSIHISMAIPVLVYLLSQYIKKDYLPISFWLLCFSLSLANYDLSQVVNDLMFIDDRVEMYSEMVTEDYDTRYRTDFLLYSIIPMVIVYIYKRKMNFIPVLFSRLYHTYIITNALWLLVIRMAFTNRIAYLSWMIIPYMVLYPIIMNQVKIKNPQSVIFKLMALFMGVNVILSLRDLFV
ncbi:MAG: EpsG family protein [Aeriscardovia sp.]|nr:EpsG family protein [Aeriscardovia sp.]